MRPRPGRQSSMILAPGESFEYIIANLPSDSMEPGQETDCALDYGWSQLSQEDEIQRRTLAFPCNRIGDQ